MRTTIAVGLMAGMLVAAGGCAHNSVWAHNTSSSGVFYGTDGIWGDNNTRTIERDSRLDKISIIGDGNTYIVDDDVRLRKIEIFGEENTISIPEHLVVQWNTVGNGNKLIRRPAGIAAVSGAMASDRQPSDSSAEERSAENMQPKDEPDSP